MDVVKVPPGVLINGIDLHHNIIPISSEPSEEQIAIFSDYPPTLFVSEDSCYAAACTLSKEYSPYLGCVNFSSLSTEMLGNHWRSIAQKIERLKK